MDLIETVDDQDRQIAGNSLKYLNAIMHLQPMDVPTLKSLYRTKCRLLEYRRRMVLENEKKNEHCERCLMKFAEGPTKYEVRPAKLSPFAKKLIKKVEAKAALTPYQTVYYKKLCKRYPNGLKSSNKLVTVCGFCKKELTVWMIKPEQRRVKRSKASTEAAPAAKKKKRKKKVDRFCGLNKDAVVVATEGKSADQSSVDAGTVAFRTGNKSISKEDLQTAKGTLLKVTPKKIQKIKPPPPPPPVVPKSRKEREAQKKKMDRLKSLMLNKKNEEKVKPASRLKEFLAGLDVISV